MQHSSPAAREPCVTSQSVVASSAGCVRSVARLTRPAALNPPNLCATQTSNQRLVRRAILQLHLRQPCATFQSRCASPAGHVYRMVCNIVCVCIQLCQTAMKCFKFQFFSHDLIIWGQFLFVYFVAESKMLAIVVFTVQPHRVGRRYK